MNEAKGSYLRWRAADDSGRDEDADLAFQTVFRAAMPDQPVSPEFAARTMTAIAAAAERDVRRAKYLRAAVMSGATAATVAAVYFGAGWLTSLVTAAFMRVLNLLIAATVGGVAAFQTGASVWSVLASLGRAAASFASDPNVTLVMIAISVVAIAALLALQRLLGSDEESFQ
jgi:hypothetical protein